MSADLRDKRLAKDENIELLLVIYGNAMFDCGEFDFEDNVPQAYDQLIDAVEVAKSNLLDAIESRMEK